MCGLRHANTSGVDDALRVHHKQWCAVLPQYSSMLSRLGSPRLATAISSCGRTRPQFGRPLRNSSRHLHKVGRTQSSPTQPNPQYCSRYSRHRLCPLWKSDLGRVVPRGTQPIRQCSFRDRGTKTACPTELPKGHATTHPRAYNAPSGVITGNAEESPTPALLRRHTDRRSTHTQGKTKLMGSCRAMLELLVKRQSQNPRTQHRRHERPIAQRAKKSSRNTNAGATMRHLPRRRMPACCDAPHLLSGKASARPSVTSDHGEPHHAVAATQTTLQGTQARESVRADDGLSGWSRRV